MASSLPSLDEKHRPITAGGFVEGAPVVFEDATKKAGLDRFKDVSGSQEKNLILEAPGSGVAIFDGDNDGWPDLYVTNYGKKTITIPFTATRATEISLTSAFKPA